MRPLLRRSRFKEKRRRKKISNFNSLTLPPKELEAQEMRPLLRRPRFEEKNKKENKIQHHFIDCAANKKNQTQAMCLLFRRRRFERNCRKSKWQPHPTFFSGWWLSHDWICWVMRCLLSQVILLEKDHRNFGTTNKNKYRVHAVNPLEKKWGFCRTAC